MSDATSFWKFIQEHSIEIPIIQRDYAQGRLGKEYLRESFLKNLKQAMKDNNRLTLDFIYGSTCNGKLHPLDGQQRLTTLWLLHWYIALKAGKLKDASGMLRKFTYETRISSREFFEKLCSPDNFTDYNGSKVVDFITSRTWFYSSWKQDPTIQSMLRMLGGTKINDKKNHDIIDGIEELFENESEEQFEKYWECLTSDESPIVFYELPLENFGLSDDLYIKMNARGKQLTSFENFKADLVGYMYTKVREDEEDWKELVDTEKGIPIKLDTTWTDLFWKHHSSAFHIDEIYFTFLNRLFWNEMFIAKDSDGYVLKVGKGKISNGSEESNNIENKSLSYTYLNADRFDKYESFEPYRYFKGNIPIQFFRDMEIIIDRYIQYNGDIPVASWMGMDKFDFIPKYEKTEKHENIRISSITQIQRIVFFAVCKYFKEGEADNLSLNRWMRVVCNAVSCEGEDGSSQIRSAEAVRKTIDYLSRIDSHNVYASLCSQQPETERSAIGSRWNEEISKAKQIWNKDSNDLRVYEGGCVKGNTRYKTWEEIIIDAEKYAFFKGAIRFLYRNDIGEENWNDFDKKWTMVQKFFKDSCSSKGSVMNDDFRNAELLKSLISNFSVDNFWKTLWWNHRTFNNRPESWMYYLLNDNICSPVHILLMNGVGIKPLAASKNFAENTLYLLSNTGLLDFVRNKIRDSWIRRWRSHGHYAIYPSGTGVFLDAEKRDKFLLETPGVTIKDDYKIDNTRLLYGSDINFEYHGKNFQWYRTDFIYLMEDKDPNDYKLKDKSKKEETEKYYCFNAKELDDSQIIKGLSSLLEIHT